MKTLIAKDSMFRGFARALVMTMVAASLSMLSSPATASGAIAASVSPAKIAPGVANRVVTLEIPAADFAALTGTLSVTGLTLTQLPASSVTISTSAATQVGVTSIFQITLPLLAEFSHTLELQVTDSAVAPVVMALSGTFSVVQPQVTGFSASGSISPVSGGSTITLTGTNLLALHSPLAISVGIPVTYLVTVTDTEISFITPSNPAGQRAIVIKDNSGFGPIAPSTLDVTYYDTANLVSVRPAVGGAQGGTQVVIEGYGFELLNPDFTTVTLAGIPASNVVVVNSTIITATSGALAVGTDFLSGAIAVADGSLSSIGSVIFDYSAVRVSSVAPDIGPASGGTPITITGSGFSLLDSALAVEIGGNAATSVVFVSDTEITAVTPVRANTSRTVGPAIAIVKGALASATPVSSPFGDEIYFNFTPKLDTITVGAQVLLTGEGLATRSDGGPITKTAESFLGGTFKFSGSEVWNGVTRDYADRSFTDTTVSRESWEVPTAGSYLKTVATHGGLTDAVKLDTGSLNCVFSNTVPSGPFAGETTFCSAFGPDLKSERFYAAAGDSLSFRYKAISGGDHYEIYAYLVQAPDLVTAVTQTQANSDIILHERGGPNNEVWTSSETVIPSNGFFYFRFVNGSFDASGGKALGASMFIDPNIFVGRQNAITFPAIPNQVGTAKDTVLTSSLTSLSGAVVSISTTSPAQCSVAATYDAVTKITTASVTLLANGNCSLTASQGSVGLFGPAASVTNIFNISSLTTVPSAPTGLTALGGILGAEIDCTPPAGVIIGYEYSLDSGATWLTAPEATCPFRISLSAGNHAVTLRALNASGAGAATAAVNVTSLPMPRASSPTGIGSVVQVGDTAKLTVSKITGTVQVRVNGILAEITGIVNGVVSFNVPNLPAGLYDVEYFETGVGTLGTNWKITFPKSIRIIATEATPQQTLDNLWTTVTRSNSTIRFIAKRPVGLGKFQFKLNGEEIAWIRAVDETDPKLRFANDAAYLVRRVDMQTGRNAAEIYLDGVRVWRAAYWLAK